MSNLREYCVILHSKHDLDNFYEQMEGTYQSESIPQRQVELSARRPISRSTRYYLTVEEAEKLKKDPRVKTVSLSAQERNLQLKPTGLQTSDDAWDKSPYNGFWMANWGVLRAYERAKTNDNWGNDGDWYRQGTVRLTNTGKNVDVVIADGHFPHEHPEFALNDDGSGGSRVVPINWFQYSQEAVGSISNSIYQYDLLDNPTAINNNNHGANVAGIAVGNTCGFARGANIYNINPYSAGPGSESHGNALYQSDFLNYIRAWHNNKSINPQTRIKNPTIVNMSIGVQSVFYLPAISYVFYQGSYYMQPDTGWGAYPAYFGLHANDGIYLYLVQRDDELDNDCIDAINDGIILVSAAGNFYGYNDVPGGPDYDNWFEYDGGQIYYQRGASPSAAEGVINVSAVDSTISEEKPEFSNAGPRTDIFAAGTNIMGAYVSETDAFDIRNTNYYRGKSGGTSQASPQVAGILGAALETYPWMKQTNARDYILSRGCTTGQLEYELEFNTALWDSGFYYSAWRSLFGGPNRYAAYYNEKQTFGSMVPKNDHWVKPNFGKLYPRPRLRKTR